MSHLHERKEKICLNCNTSLQGRYCHVCGQENIEPKESVWHLVNHFFQDITHFDGKFFSTVKLLITKPGFLSKEYMLGKRASYLNPIRMYVFTSAIFFLIFFSLTNAGDIMKIDEKGDKTDSTTKRGLTDFKKDRAKLQSRLNAAREFNDGDSSDLKDEIEKTDLSIAAIKEIYGDSTSRKFNERDIALLLLRVNMDSLKKQGMPPDVASAVNTAIGKRDSSKKGNNGVELDFGNEKYATPAAYDSAQSKLPSNKQDWWLKKMAKRKIIEMDGEFKKDKRAYIEHLEEKFVHSFPKILFISLPFFALILRLVYVRRKEFYYTSHGIFAIHLYCATFIFLLAMILLNQLGHLGGWKWLQGTIVFLDFVLWLYVLIYMYKAMRRFYGQGRFKTIVKYLIVNFLAFMLNAILLAIFILISAISV